MTEHQVGEFLLDLALLFALTYLLAGLLERVRIPGILAALFVAMVVHYTPLGERLRSPFFYSPKGINGYAGGICLLKVTSLLLRKQNPWENNLMLK